jgi:hypothetical protein
MVHDSTKVGIDTSLLKRIEKVMPSYHQKKAFVNHLLDEAVSRLESRAEVPKADV